MRGLLALALTCLLSLAAAAHEGPRLMYHDPAVEKALLNRFRAAGLDLPVLRLGAMDRGGRRYAMAHFLAGSAPRSRVRRQAVRMIRAAFSGIQGLEHLDLAGLDRPETRERRPAVLFSVSVRRERVARMDPDLPPGAQLAAAGPVWFSPVTPPDPPPGPALARALRGALPHPVPPEGLEAHLEPGR